MTSLTRRTREKEATRALILSAARELFVAEGIEGVSMRRIAQAIEYTPTAIYHHFQDKESLIRELCDSDFRVLASVFVRAAGIANPIARLRAIGHAYIEFGLEHRAQYRFMFLTPHGDTGHLGRELMKGNPEEDAYAFLRQTVAQAIAEGHLRPELADADQVAQMVWSGCHGFVSLRIFYEQDDWISWQDPQQTADALLNAMLHGIVRTAT